MIDITNLEKRFSSGFYLKIDGLHIENGERVAVIGNNGSGKSTLFKILSGIVKPDGGSFKINACGLTGYQPQAPYCFAGTVEYNIKLGQSPGTDIEKLLCGCQLSGLRKKKISELSGGERQRMCFARMLAGRYELLILDEPFSCTDIETAETLCSLLVDYCEKNGATLLFSTHLPSQAFAVATKILIMNNGEVAEYSDASAVTAPVSEFGRKFISQWRVL